MNLNQIGLRLSTKGATAREQAREQARERDEGRTHISPQMNFATDAATYLAIRKSPRAHKEKAHMDYILAHSRKPTPVSDMYFQAKRYREIISQAQTGISLPCSAAMPQFLEELADRLAQSALIPNLKVEDSRSSVPGKKLNPHMLSHVKDMSDIWAKTSLEKIAAGFFTAQDYEYLQELCTRILNGRRVEGISITVVDHLKRFCGDKRTREEKVEFMHHSMLQTGVRQDTYIDLSGQPKTPSVFARSVGDETQILPSFVVEIRNHDTEGTLDQMHEDMKKAIRERDAKKDHAHRQSVAHDQPRTAALPQNTGPGRQKPAPPMVKSELFTKADQLLNACSGRYPGTTKPPDARERAEALIAQLETLAPEQKDLLARLRAIK